MRQFINIVTEAQTKSFKLHPSLDAAKYIMTNSLKDVARWRAYTYSANNGGEVGDMCEVGYVMISLRDNTIIPIARNDEHHMGRDLLYDLADRDWGDKPLDPEDYVPIYTNGGNYVYHETDQGPLLIVLKKYLAYGGADTILTGTYDMDGYMMHMSDFIAANGTMRIKHADLAPVGKRVYDLFKAATVAYRGVREMDRISQKPFFDAAKALCRYLDDYSFYYLVGTSLHGWEEKVNEWQKAGDVDSLEEFIFSYHGIKNTLHTSLKKIGPKDYMLDRAEAMWGNLPLAINMLADL